MNPTARAGVRDKKKGTYQSRTGRKGAQYPPAVFCIAVNYQNPVRKKGIKNLDDLASELRRGREGGNAGLLLCLTRGMEV